MSNTPYLDAAVRSIEPGNDDGQTLCAINAAVQRWIQYEDDMTLFGCRQRTVTAEETLQLGKGDCEDYAWAVHEIAVHMGVPESDMEICYCLVNGYERHAVLNYRNGELIIDSQAIDARPLDRRPDLSDLRPIDKACFPTRVGEAVPPLRLA